MPKETGKTLRRSMPIERSATGIPLGYDPSTRTCGLSFSSETEEVLRGADYEVSQRLKSREYREILNHDDADFDFLRVGGSLLKNHDHNQVIGSIESVEGKDNRGIARVKFTSTQAGKDAEIEVAEGALRCTSFGYEHKPNGRIIPLGEKFVHHGREISGPAILTGFRALEITLTPIPADSTTGVGRSKEGSLEVIEMPSVAIKPEVRSYCRIAGVKKKLTAAELESILRHEMPPESNEEADAMIASIISERSSEFVLRGAAGGTIQTTAVIASQATTVQTTPLSRASIKNIMGRAALASLTPEETNNVVDSAEDENHASTLIVDALQNRAKKEGALGGVRTSVAEGCLSQELKAIKEVEFHLASDFAREWRNAPPQLTRGDDEVNMKREVASDPVKDYFKEFEGLGFKDTKHREPSYLLNTFLKGIGVPSDDLERMSTSAKAQFVFGHECADLIRDRVIANNSGSIRLFERDSGSPALSGTASFPFLFENIQNKSLRQMYARYDPTWQYWCRKGSLKDFKKTSRIQISDAGDLLLMRENEAPRGATFTDEVEYIQLSKYGRMFSFSWESMINDDVGGMARTTMNIGQSCMRLPSKLLYTDLLSNPTLNADSTALFASGHNNLNNATASAISATNLNSMWAAMKKQKGKIAPLDVNQGGVSDNLDLTPQLVLGPPDIHFAASKLLEPNFFQVSGDGGAAAGATFFTGYVKNVGKLTFLEEPRLSNSDYTTYSATGYYLIADPRQTPAYEVSFLDGNAEPILVQRQNYQTLGLETTVTLPVAIKALEWRPIQFNAGA